MDFGRNWIAAILLQLLLVFLPRPFEHVRAEQVAHQVVPVLQIQVLETYPHDAKAFTQGLEYREGFLFESTGITGQSSLRKVELKSGKVLRMKALEDEYFAEGLTIFRGKIYQLTWISNKGFIYDLETFRKLAEFSYYGEGWGLTHDAANLILSDGSNHLRFLDPETFKVVRTVDVYAGNEAVPNLNELEFIGNAIYANVWHANRIARINPASGQVEAWIDCSSIVPDEQKSAEDVLNGIAFDPVKKRLLVTGKHWSHVFAVRVEGLSF